MAAKAPARRAAAPPLLWTPDRRDVIWIDFSPHSGKEMKDEHPMLVLSPKAFNDRTGIVVGLALTHSEMNKENPFAEKFVGAKGEVCYVLCHQPKSFDWRTRPARPHPMKHVPPDVFKAACDLLNQIVAIG